MVDLLLSQGAGVARDSLSALDPAFFAPERSSRRAASAKRSPADERGIAIRRRVCLAEH